MVITKQKKRFKDVQIGDMFCVLPDGYRTPRKTTVNKIGHNWYMADTKESGYIEPDTMVELLSWGAT